MNSRIHVCVVLALLAASLNCPAAEQAPPPGGETPAKATFTPDKKKNYLPWEKGSFMFGGFLATFDSTLGFGVDRAADVTFDAEDLFDLDNNLTVFRVEGMLRPGKSRRHQVDLIYARYNRDGTATLEQDITINGNPYAVGARVDSVFNFTIIRGTYSYALIQDERMRIAIGLGVYAVPLRYELKVETAGGGRDRVEGADVTLPLPAIALRGDFQLIPRLFLKGSIDAMYLSISDFEGSLLDVNLALEWRPWNRVAFGVGYNGLSVKVEGEGDSSDYPGADFVGTVDVSFSGLMLYGKLTF